MRRTAPLLAAAGVLAATACTSSGSSSSPGPVSTTGGRPTATAPSTSSSPPARALDWPTYHGQNDRSGVARGPVVPAPPLHRAWSAALDGAVYAQPIVVGGVVIAATENNTVYAMRARDGRALWRRHLGAPVPLGSLPCGNIDPLGITGTPAYDATTGNVFVVTETAGARHTLHALDVRTGRDRWHRSMDVAGGRDRSAEQQRAALLVTDGRVYVAFGGLFGDCGNYVGYVAAVSTNGTGSTLTYEIPTAREAGMWAPPGPVVGPGGDLYVASGNGAETGGHYDGSDSVVRLTPKLHEVALFAPSTWAADNAQDLDLGSSSPVPVAGQIVIAGKRGSVYLLSSALGGVGAQRATLDGCPAYGGAATRGAMVVLPCNGGIRALRVVGHRMHWVWSTPGLGGSPVMAGPHVFALDQDAGDLVAVAAGTGHEQWRAHVGEVSRFATPALHERYIYVGTTRGVVALRGAA